jgi:SAM-dependent methyltransferase
MSDTATNAQTIKAYNGGVDAYAAGMRHEVAAPLQRWMARALDTLDKNAQILEIGSGTGRDANYLESLGYHVQRTDASQGFVDYLRAQGKAAALLNVLTDALPEGCDLIQANAVFLHFTESEFIAALAKVFKTLKPNGHFALSLKRGDGEETTSHKLDAPRYFHYWQPAEAKALLERAGFMRVVIDASDDWRPDKPEWLFITAEKGAQ